MARLLLSKLLIGAAFLAVVAAVSYRKQTHYGFAPMTNRQKASAESLLSQRSTGKGPGSKQNTIKQNADLRLDDQGVTSNGYRNYQIQINGPKTDKYTTIAQAHVKLSVDDRAGNVRDAALRQSLNSNPRAIVWAE